MGFEPQNPRSLATALHVPRIYRRTQLTDSPPYTHVRIYKYICIPWIGKVSVGFYRRSNNMLLFFGQAKHLYIYGLAHSIRITTTRAGWNRYRLQFRLRHDDTVETGAAEPNIKTTVCIYLGIVRACACVVYTHERCTVVSIYVRDVILGRRKSILDAAPLR